jgi:hypothetical protein
MSTPGSTRRPARKPDERDERRPRLAAFAVTRPTLYLGTTLMRRLQPDANDLVFALNEASVFNEASARDLTAALAWGNDDELRATAEHAVRMAERVAQFLAIARAAA